ncbi:hypothetical protein HMPREF1624_07362 [Sporothrix schenckii ATCC 58251]|uniref:Uncharacterized protein n=1 Tax=Sporothrix schenckii (strain ATCC 58251 / de Perez 2211183) TaxID=1391915 RepID=U7PNG0_SPOS1|nr:hypothetical protein HMPREF1624_07362 [Sporothrix schenckii ATCC 58251]
MSSMQANGNDGDGNNQSRNRTRNERFRLRDFAAARGGPARMQAPAPAPAPAPAHGDGDMNNDDNNDNDIDINNIIDVNNDFDINDIINAVNINNIINAIDNAINDQARNDRFRVRDMAATRGDGGPARMQAVDILNQRPIQNEIRVATGGAPRDSIGGEAPLPPRPASQHGMLTRSQGQSVVVQAGARRGETVIVPRHRMTRRSQTNLAAVTDEQDEKDDVDMTDMSLSEGDKDESDAEYTA